MSSDLSTEDLSRLSALAAKYSEACDLERKLWHDVKGKHPGQPGHQPDAWQKWVDVSQAIQSLDLEMKSLRDRGSRRTR